MLDIQKYNISNDFILKSMPCNYLKTTSSIYEGRKDVDDNYIFEGSSIVFNDVQINEDFIPLGVYNVRSVASMSNDDLKNMFNQTLNQRALEPLKGICTETFEYQDADIFITAYVLNTQLNAKMKRLFSLRNVLHGLNVDYTQLMIQPLTFKPILYYASFNDADIENNKQTFELFYLTKP